VPLAGAAAVAFGAPLGCGSQPSSAASTYLDRGAMLDPQTCLACHADHYRDWAGSMHAYASDDPVFLAMNQRGQRETSGKLGSFCVKCHAPVALAEGATIDGTNLANVPQSLKGVTCFYCHSIDAVTGTHDAAVTTARDLVMRGEYSDPLANGAHAAGYAALQDRDRLDSASLCGACHDIVTPPGAAIERTFSEWQSSVFSHPQGGSTCGQCHMNESTSPKPIAQVPGAKAREYHAHDFPAVDVALTPGFPNAAAEQQAILAFLQSALQTALCVTQQGGVRVIVDSVSAGHNWPSGATQDRRAWAEVIASAGGTEIYRSGVVPDGMPIVGAAPDDPDLWVLRDCMFDSGGNQVNMFWQAATTQGNEIPVQTSLIATDPGYYQSHIYQRFPRALNAVLPMLPDQVTLRIRLQPIGLEVLEMLEQSDDLDPSVAGLVPTYDVVPLLTWTPASATLTYEEDGQPVSCVSTLPLNVGATKYLAAENAGCSP
jgi:hypothetical protein